MKKTILSIVAFALVVGIASAQVKSSVIKNTADTEVFSVAYGSGAATVTVNGVVSPTTISGATTISGTTITENSLAVPVVQVDTNATTTVTLYTPNAAGDFLIGSEGGSNRVWISEGATTNNWTIKIVAE